MIRLLNDLVLVEPLIDKELNGLIIPDTLSAHTQRGIVQGVGPGIPASRGGNGTLETYRNDVIMYVKFAGSEVSIDGKYNLIMRENDIMAIFNDPNGDRLKLTPLRNRIFIEWEEGKEEFGNSKILRPYLLTQRHYTGIVLSKGVQVENVEVGDRIFFNQFCGPERIDKNGKRYAFIYDKDAFCVIPSRVEMSVLSQ